MKTLYSQARRIADIARELDEYDYRPRLEKDENRRLVDVIEDLDTLAAVLGRLAEDVSVRELRMVTGS